MGAMTIFLAVLVLGFLIFIHELGHYFMARWAGMRVNAFGIGFGTPLAKWTWDGVEWRLGVLPFGGYVSIAGMYDDEGEDPRNIKDGYYGKGPIARILVAFMGPAVNLLFAFLLLTLLFTGGGREKSFSEYTHRIGWVDPKSELFEKGVRPGDLVYSYEGTAFKRAQDHLMAPMISDGEFEVHGAHVDPLTQEKREFTYTVGRYSHPRAADKDILTAGIFGSASYLIYDKPTGETAKILKLSDSVKRSGLTQGDRILWADGEVIYSVEQLSHLLNDGKSLVSVRRGNEILQLRVPRLALIEFQLPREVREELTDWQFETRLRDRAFNQLLFIPYNVSPDAVVESRLTFLDADDAKFAFPEHRLSEAEAPLLEGDRIIAVDGTPVSNGSELLQKLQDRQIQVIVERNRSYSEVIPVAEADEGFNRFTNWADLDELASSIGSEDSATSVGSLHRLAPLKLITERDRFAREEDRRKYDEAVKAQRTQIMRDVPANQRKVALEALEKGQNRKLLGIPLRDRAVIYNPGPVEAFTDMVGQTFNFLGALFTGRLNVKFLSGPVGIVHIISSQAQVAWADVAFLMAFISLQLGLLNLLPIPILDGGHICFALYEMVSGRPVKQKTMEWVTIPFYFLLIGLALILTYHDIWRIIRSLLGSGF